MEVVCNRAAGLPAVPVLLLSGQGIVTNHTFYLFVPLTAMQMTMQRNAAGRFFPFWLIALIVWDFLASS